MKPAPFAYHRANSVPHAVALLAELGDEAKIIAGGQSLVAMMNLRLARPSALVDVNRVRGLSAITVEGEILSVGALVRHAAIEHYPGVLDGFSLLPRAARWVGHYPVRARGTVGGSLAHADPAAEWCVVALVLGAEFVACGPTGSRTIPAAEFFQGFFTTALRPDEMLLEVRLTRPAQHSSLQEFARRHGDFAIVVTAVAFDTDDGIVRHPRVALGGVAPQPVRLRRAEEVLEGAPATRATFVEAAAAAVQAIEPPSDSHGSGKYRRELATVLVERALNDALAHSG